MEIKIPLWKCWNLLMAFNSKLQQQKISKNQIVKSITKKKESVLELVSNELNHFGWIALFFRNRAPETSTASVLGAQSPKKQRDPPNVI